MKVTRHPAPVAVSIRAGVFTGKQEIRQFQGETRDIALAHERE